MGKFLPGQSGNPDGRREGSRNKSSRALDDLIPMKERKAIVAALVKKAKDGDATAAGLLLDRVWPKLRAVAPTVVLDLPAGSLVDRAEAIVTALAAGNLSSDAAAEVLGALAAIGRLKELTEFEARLTDIERRLTGTGEGHAK